MRKQKAGTPKESSIKASKIPKYSTPSGSQDQHNNTSQSLTQNLQSQTQNFSKVINFTQVDNVDQLTEIWNYAKEGQMTVSQDQNQVRCIEMKELLAQTNSEIERLQKSICQEKNDHAKMTKHIKERRKVRNAIIEMQNLAKNLNSVIQEHTDAITKQAEDCDETLKHLTELYNDAGSKQEVIIKNLTEQLNSQESVKNKELENEMELQSHELSIQKTESNKLESEMEKITQLTNTVDANLEKNEMVIQQNNKKYENETAEISACVEKIYTNLKDERERKSKWLTEQNESSKKYAELLSKYKELQTEDAGYRSRIEKSKFTKLDWEKKGASVANEFEELKNTHLVFNSNRELEIAELRTKIQDLTSLSRETANKLKQAVSTDKELSKNLAQTVEHNEKLENVFKNKDIEMMKMRNELSDVLVKNTELIAKVQRQKDELIAIEKEINQNRVDLETCKDKQDEIVETEVELSAELATIEMQLSDKHEDLLEPVKKASDEESKSLKQLEKLESVVKDKNNSITRGEKRVEDPRRDIRRSQLEWNKKLQITAATLPPKPILKSPYRESPLKVQKVHFKFGTPSEANSVKIAEYWEEAERRYAATAAKNKPDWSKVQIVTSSQEADTTAPVVTETQPKPQTQQVQARKFFKTPRMEMKKTSKFSKK